MTAGGRPSRLAPFLPFLELVGLSGLVVASPVLQVFEDGARPVGSVGWPCRLG